MIYSVQAGRCTRKSVWDEPERAPQTQQRWPEITYHGLKPLRNICSSYSLGPSCAAIFHCCGGKKKRKESVVVSIIFQISNSPYHGSHQAQQCRVPVKVRRLLILHPGEPWMSGANRRGPVTIEVVSMLALWSRPWLDAYLLGEWHAWCRWAPDSLTSRVRLQHL